MRTDWDIVVVGSGNAALCAALAAQEQGRAVLVLEKAPPELASGNTAYTAGAMRFAYDGNADLMPLLADPDDPRLARTDFGSYTRETFGADLLGFNDGRPLSVEQEALVGESLETLQWMSTKGIKFEPIYSRQSFEKDGRFIFWGGLTLAAKDEGFGLAEAERDAFTERGGTILFDRAATDVVVADGRVTGVETRTSSGETRTFNAHAVVLASGGFGSNKTLRTKYLGRGMDKAVVRGTPHNTGDGLDMAFRLGAKPHGIYEGCHATPMDLYTPENGNLDLPHLERKHYRKICYFLGVMINADGHRFVDEGKDFRNYTYAQFGRSILEQPKGMAFQIFDAKVDHLLYSEYKFHDAHWVEADTIDALLDKIEGLDDKAQARATIDAFNTAVDPDVPFDPTIKDGKSAHGLEPPRSHWAQRLDTGPFKAYPVTGGITFTYGGVEVDTSGAVMKADGSAIPGLFACGEMVGGVFFNGYPGGSGLTSGAVFGRRAGLGAASFAGTARPARCEREVA